MYFKFLKLVSFKNIIFILISVNLIISAYLPISINANAPHDDTLFYRLGQQFSAFNWLGSYNSGTFLKGPIFPFFIGFAEILNIPFRLLESFLVVAASTYFILNLKKLQLDKLFLIIIFCFLIFYPFVNSVSNYRLLREIIYPWFLLLVFSELILIYFNVKNNSNFETFFLNSLRLGFFLFLFWNTREEGLFIIPGFVFAFLLLTLFFFKKIKKIIFVFFVSLSFLFFFNLMLKNINSYVYGYPVIVEFKDKNYIRGMNAFYRVKQNVDYEFAAPSKETWKKIFKNSKTAQKLEEFVFGPQYYGWSQMACANLNNSHWENHGFKKRYNCKGRMPAGFMLFAIRDAFLPLGLNSPKKISNFLNNIHLEIDSACKNGKLDCHNIPDILIPFETYSTKIMLESLKLLPLSLKTSFIIPFPAPNSTFSNGSDEDLSEMAKNLKAKVFPTYKLQNENYLKKLNINNEFKKYFLTKDFLDNSALDYVKYNRHGILEIKGFIRNQILNEEKIIINIDNKKICYPKILQSKKEIQSNFECKIKYILEENQAISLKALYKTDSGKFEIISNTKNINKLIKNQFDEKCYLENNPDVKSAVEKKEMKSGYEHWINYGINEQRKCVPLFTKYFEKKNKDEFSYYSLSKLSYKVDYLYYILFKYFYSIFPIFLIAFIYCVYKKKEYFILISCLIILSISFTRVFMLSIFHVNYMAPISGHYLMLSIFLNHLVFILIMSFVVTIFLRFF